MNRTLHHHTPSLTASDSRGLTVRHVAYHRASLDDRPHARISRHQHDSAGRVIAAWDARLHAAKRSPNQTSVFSLSGVPLLTRSVDSGTRINRYANSGAIRESWDGRGTHWRTDYDALLRPTQLTEQLSTQPARVISRFTYAPYSPEAAVNNQCSRLTRQDDTAGTLLFADYGLQGQPLSETRHFLKNVDLQNWPLDPVARDSLLEPGAGASTHWTFSAAGDTLVQTDAMGNQQQTRYDLSGAVARQQLHLETGAERPLLTDVVYNASGQIEQQTAGNGVFTENTFDPADGSLQSQRTVTSDKRTLQRLHYAYDPVGNVLAIEDRAVTPGHFANQRIDPINLYTYDSLSQLIHATGREAVGATLGPQLPDLDLTPGDTSRLLNFTQAYEYDSAGNLTRTRHTGHSNYTRSKFVSPDSNRCLPINADGTTPDPLTAFDANGNLQALESGQTLTWDGFNRLQRTVLLRRDNNAHDDERYVYDLAGARVRKITTTHAKSATHVAHVRYLPGLEIHHDGPQQLHIVTAQAGQSAVRHLHWEAGKPSGIDNDQCRYSVHDPMDSSAMELDQAANLLSHEGYYPYGGSAWWAAKSAVQAKYKTIRYSGKERDASGLYYYGERYYAPWLAQWINPDPGGTIDGLNLYRMTGNNPVTYGDPNGMSPSKKTSLSAGIDRLVNADRADWEKIKTKAAAERQRQAAKLARKLELVPLEEAVAIHREVLKISDLRAVVAHQQLLNHVSLRDHLTSATKRAGTVVVSSAISTGAGIGGAALGTALLPGLGTAAGYVGGYAIGKAASLATSYGAEQLGLSASVKLKTSKLDANKIFKEAEHNTADLSVYLADTLQKSLSELRPTTSKEGLKLAKDVSKFALGKAPGGKLLKLVPEIPEIVHENVSAASGLTPEKLAKLDTNTTGLISEIEGNFAKVSSMFATTQAGSVSTPEIGNVFAKSTVESLQRETTAVINQLDKTRALGKEIARRN